MVGFYFLSSVLGAKPLQAMALSIAYGFGSYFFLNLEAGHNTKVHALAYMAPILGALVLTLKRQYLVGGILLVLLLSIQIYKNHLQITYYTMMAAGLLYLVSIIFKVKEKDFKGAGISFGVLLIGVLIAFGTNSTRLLVVQEYAKETTRGGQSDLSTDQSEQEKGVGRDYAYGWSYGISETFTLLYPNAAGGGGKTDYSGTELFKNLQSGSATMEDEQVNSIAGLFLYWGEISSAEESPVSTSGTIYFGVAIWFFFFLALVLSPWNNYKIWLLLVTVFAILLSWGRHFPVVIDIFFNFFPYFDKFRVPMMFLTVAQFGAAGMAILGVRDLFSEAVSKEKKLNALKITGGVFLGLGAILYVAPGIFFDFSSFNDSPEVLKQNISRIGVNLQQWAQLMGIQGSNDDQIISAFKDLLIEDRKGMLQASVLRTTIFAVIIGVLCWLYVSEKFRQSIYIGAILAVLVLIDQWPIAKQYLNEKNFMEEGALDRQLAPSQADLQILKDSDYFRVFNISQNPLAYSNASYYHHSISGYHAAKLQRWQDFAENLLLRDWQLLLNNQANLQAALGQTPAVNMFNAKYLILNPNAAPVSNPNALGNAWFVNDVLTVPNADSTIAVMKQRNWMPGNTAVVDISDSEGPGENLEFGSPSENDQIKFVVESYQPNYLKYNSSTSGARLAVFSEVYYRGNKDWVAYIDGNEAEHFRVNFLQRGMIIPEGEHVIEFKFEPKTFKKGVTISSISSLLGWLLILGGIFVIYKRNKSGEKEAA
jgi:hypothetical protein